MKMLSYDELSLRLCSSFQFQRLHGKTQLFANEEKDNYCNRLTHTLQVVSIANVLAEMAGEAHYHHKISRSKLTLIALAHDIGHTPFGHVGERTLHSILSGEDHLGGMIHLPQKYGFKHNVNSAKIFMEAVNLKKNERFDGDILLGIILHSKLAYPTKQSNPPTLDYGLRSILKNTLAAHESVADVY
jgi:dGTPase